MVHSGFDLWLGQHVAARALCIAYVFLVCSIVQDKSSNAALKSALLQVGRTF
jgi:hypothetical protein